MDIRRILENYLSHYDDEQVRLNNLLQQLDQPADITSRKNFNGHVTASAFIINRGTNQVLLLEHKALKRFLQPGGHVDPSDKTLTGSALREIEEETGLRSEDLLLAPATPQHPDVPFDIDTHHIPENPQKGEPEHDHHDFRYVFITDKKIINIDQSESGGYRWVEWDDFKDDVNFQHNAKKIRRLLEPSVSDFFKSVTPINSKDISVLAVSHIIPSSEDYIKSLKEHFNLIGIIPKPKSINSSSAKRLNDYGVPLIAGLNRESLEEDPSQLIELLRGYDNICLIDIGGYFSKCLDMIEEELSDRLLGVVEDTENGLKRYENRPKNNYRVMTVARSQLKNYEDQLVGHSIVHATETVLRKINVLITYKKCGVIGYGKVGKGIVEYLQQRNVNPTVSETNSIRCIQASCDGAVISSTEDLIKSCDIIFCATGARALDILRLRDVRQGAYLASATSSEDEFDLSSIEPEYTPMRLDNYTTRYSKRGHFFHLLNDGNAINFLYSAAVDKYIHLVQGELIFSLGKLADAKKQPEFHKDIRTNSSADQDFIAQMWIFYILRPEHSPKP